MSVSAGTRRISSTTSNPNHDSPLPRAPTSHHHHPMRHRPLLHIRDTNRRLVLGMVGLPARGKTYIAKKICRWLTWLGYKVSVFNVGNYRRRLAGVECDSGFFDPNNSSGAAIRNQCATAALKDLCQYFEEGGQAAIYDATNSTRERRAMVAETLRQSKFSCELVWIESICNDEDIVANNIRDTKLFSPDYANKDADEAVADFQRRIDMYRAHYEPVTEDELSIEQSYVKLIDGGRRVETCEINGYLPARIVFFLMHLQINHNPIFVSRHGESEYNVLERLGGDSGLSKNGMEYAKILAEFIRSHDEIARLSAETDTRLQIWSSTLKRTVQTATSVYEANRDLCDPVVQWRALCEIDAGVCDGLTYPEVEAKDPEGFAARQRDKLGYRYPQGESYLDVIDRLEPVIFEIERAKGPILVIGHQAVLRCLFGYFLDVPMSDIAFLDVPLHNVIKLTPKAYGCQIEHFQLLEDPHAKKTKAAMAMAAAAAAHQPQPVSPSAGSIGTTATSPPNLINGAAEKTTTHASIPEPTPIVTTPSLPPLSSTPATAAASPATLIPTPLSITSPMSSYTPPLTPATASASSGFIPIVGSVIPTRTGTLEDDLQLLNEEANISSESQQQQQQQQQSKRHSTSLKSHHNDITQAHLIQVATSQSTTTPAS